MDSPGPDERQEKPIPEEEDKKHDEETKHTITDYDEVEIHGLKCWSRREDEERALEKTTMWVGGRGTQVQILTLIVYFILGFGSLIVSVISILSRSRRIRKLFVGINRFGFYFDY